MKFLIFWLKTVVEKYLASNVMLSQPEKERAMFRCLRMSKYVIWSLPSDHDLVLMQCIAVTKLHYRHQLSLAKQWVFTICKGTVLTVSISSVGCKYQNSFRNNSMISLGYTPVLSAFHSECLKIAVYFVVAGSRAFCQL